MIALSLVEVYLIAVGVKRDIHICMRRQPNTVHVNNKMSQLCVKLKRKEKKKKKEACSAL